MKKVLAVAAAALAVGCSSNPRMGNGDIKPVPVTAEQRLAQARAGESVVFEGYVYNGVIVTPARNYYYGQTQGYPGPERVQGDCFISDESAKAGGEVMPECSMSVAPRPTEQRALQPTQEAEIPPAEVAGMKEGQEDQIAPIPAQGADKPELVAIPPANPFESELLNETLKLDPNGQSDLLDRALSFANAPTPRFKAGSAAVSEVDRRQLARFAADIKQLGEAVIVLIAGYTSIEGPKDLNDSLARRRASAVREILVNEGVRSDFMIAFAAPQCCYLNDNRTPAERSENRRVELKQGGRYADSGAITPRDVAVAIARMRKHMGVGAKTIRIHVQAPTPEVGAQVMRDVKAVMGRPEVGFGSIEEGVVSIGGKANVIIEVKS